MIRITGMNSGLDTEAIIQELASARSMKVENMKKSQTKMSWKMDAWKELNTKIYDFYTSTLDSMRLKSGYKSMKTTVSDESVAKVVSDGNTMKGTQKLEVKSLASSAFMSGGKISVFSHDEETGTDSYTASGSVTSGTTLYQLGLTTSDEEKINFTVKVGDKTTDMTFAQSATIQDVLDQLKKAGLNANFDEKNQRIYLGAKEDGAAGNFEITGVGENGAQALKALGLDVNATEEDLKAHATPGVDAEIVLNGITYKGATNSFTINGLSIEVQKITSEPVTLHTDTDTSGIYDKIKEFLKKYNELINEMDKLYNAEDASKYKPLSNEEKDEMSETEVKEWEDKIKSALLRRDGTLSSISDVLKMTMLEGVTLDSGKKMVLSMYEINTLSYFNAKENEKNAYHIFGDPDDADTKAEKDKLKAAIAENPDEVIEFFTKLSQTMYDKLHDRMGSTDYSSAFTVYNDKEMKKEYESYKTKIEEEQKKMNAYIDNWYSKFSKMETALAKMQSKSTAITGMLGGN